MADKNDWDWHLYSEAETFLSGLVRSFLNVNRYADVVREDMENTTSTRFIDWVDSLELPDGEVTGEHLQWLGYVKERSISNDGDVYRHPGATFFPIVLRADRSRKLSIKVEDLDRFLAANHMSHRKTVGEKNAPLRWVELNNEDDHSFCAVERHGALSFDTHLATDVKEYGIALNILSSRKRTFTEDIDGMEDLGDKIVALTDMLEWPRLADAFFRTERNYWQSKNRAALVQLKRQELLGLGWGNHDRHTFRCSRENFGNVIAIFEEMGMKRRERFFAGDQAGWGAQVMEQPDTGLVVFADVDLGPDEGHIDFVAKELEPEKDLGTVGLWVGLHGESVLDSGMRHLAIGSDFEGMREDLRSREVSTMIPFSDFDFLKQSFTEAEQWMPSKARVDRLKEAGHIQDKQASKFIGYGAVGSHMEIIQRNQGFKGFNQDSVSAIIRMTDPIERSEIGA